MASPLSSLADNLAEGLQNSECKDCKSGFEHIKVKDKLLKFRCLKWNKIITKNSIKT